MKLLTAKLRKSLPPLFSTEERHAEDIIVPFRFFVEDDCYAWYPFEFDLKTRFFFGWVEGPGGSELAHFDLDYLKKFKGGNKMLVKHDIHWQSRSLGEIMSRALMDI